jgi:surface-anchored protein
MLLLLAVVSCGGSADNGTKPGTYTLTVTATGVTAQATSTVTMTVLHR